MYNDLVNMQFKNNRNKIFKVLIIVFLFIASIIAMVFGGINIAKNNKSKGVYGESYFMSYDMDLSKVNGNQKEKEEALKQSSEAFSNWLIYRNYNVNNVQYEYINENSGRLFIERTNIPTTDYKDDKNHLQDPYMIALTTFESSRYVIQQYNPNGTNKDKMPESLSDKYETKYKETYSLVLNHSELNIDTIRKDYRKKLVSNEDTNNYGVELDLKTKTSLNIEEFNNQKTNSTEADKKIEWIVFQDVEILLTKLNYAKYLAYKNDPNTGDATEQERFAYAKLPSNLKTWADKSITGAETDAKRTIAMNNANLLYFYKMAEASAPSDSESSTRETSTGGNGDYSLKAVVDEHIKARITYDNYNDWFPTADVIGGDSSSGDNNESGGDNSESTTYSNKNHLRNGTPNVSSISFQIAHDESSQNALIDKFEKMSFDVPLKLLDEHKNISKTFSFPGKAWINKSYLGNNPLTKMDAYESSMLALGVVVLLIAIIVSILYRIPGIFGALAITSAAVFSASLLVILKVNFSMSTIAGLLVGVLISTLSIAIFMERIRKSTRDFGSIFDSSVNAMKKSMFSILDVHMILLLMGLGLVFIGKGEIIDFGLVLILTSFITYSSVMLFFILPMYLIQEFEKLWNPATYFMFSNKKMKEISFSRVEKLTNIYKKYIIPIVISIALLLLIIGLIMVFTVGVKNSIYYNSGTTIYVSTSSLNQNGSSLTWDVVLSKLPGNSWTFLWANDEYMSFVSSKIFSTNEIASALNISNENVMVSINNSVYAVEISKSSINAILTGYAFILIYGIVRLNIFSVIPLFISSVLGTTTPIAICYIFWLPIDSLFVYSSIFISIVSMLVPFSYISITKTRFLKRQISTFDELTSFILINMIHMRNILISIMSCIVIFSIVFLLFASSSMTMLFIYIIVGGLISVIFSFLIVPFLYFISLYIRQTYVKNILSRVDNRINRHSSKEVDEELIEGINKFD